jgi:hypothetical protein
MQGIPLFHATGTSGSGTLSRFADKIDTPYVNISLHKKDVHTFVSFFEKIYFFKIPGELFNICLKISPKSTGR